MDYYLIIPDDYVLYPTETTPTIIDVFKQLEIKFSIGELKHSQEFSSGGKEFRKEEKFRSLFFSYEGNHQYLFIRLRDAVLLQGYRILVKYKDETTTILYADIP